MVPTALSDLVICYNDSQNSGKHYNYECNFITKDKNQDKTNEESNTVRVEGLQNWNLLRSGCLTPLQRGCLSPTRTLIQAVLVGEFIGILLHGHA